MIKIPYEDIVAKIKEATSMSDAEIESKVKEKTALLAGLVSKEGAAHIIANELGVKLVESVSGTFKIDKIYEGMRDIEVSGKILRVFETRSFNTNGRAGMVASMIIGDETGSMRLVLWNEQAMKAEQLRENDVVRAHGAYVKAREGGVELHLGTKGQLDVNPAGVVIENVKEAPQQKAAERKKLIDINPQDDRVEVVGTIVQLFDMRFFEVCEQCGKRARLQDDVITCGQHGKVQGNYSYVVNAFLDDGTENIRLVCFREQAAALLGKNDEDIQKFRTAPDSYEPMKTELLGNMVKIVGRIKNNDMFNRMELVAQVVEQANPSEELARLQNP